MSGMSCHLGSSWRHDCATAAAVCLLRIVEDALSVYLCLLASSKSGLWGNFSGLSQYCLFLTLRTCSRTNTNLSILPSKQLLLSDDLSNGYCCLQTIACYNTETTAIVLSLSFVKTRQFGNFQSKYRASRRLGRATAYFLLLCFYFKNPASRLARVRKIPPDTKNLEISG